MKFSFVSTVFNEEKDIEKFINSLLFQTKKPDEIIIVDGGSTDKTLEILEKFKGRIKIIQKRGNRSVGRNEAIRSAKGDVVAVSDVGCIFDKNWFKNITSHFKGNIDVVAGYYLPISANVFEKSLAAYTCVMPDRLDTENFLPSSRSVAFKKSAWERVGGYPENLDTCEDLVFAKRMKDLGFVFKTDINAIVYWRQRKNIIEAFKQFLSYAVGDGKAHFFRPSTPFLFLRYIIGISLVLFMIVSKNMFILSIIFFSLFIYVIWSIVKNYKYVKDLKAFIYLPLLQFTSDFAVLAGTTFGFLNSLWDTQKKQ